MFEVAISKPVFHLSLRRIFPLSLLLLGGLLLVVNPAEASKSPIVSFDQPDDGRIEANGSMPPIPTNANQIIWETGRGLASAEPAEHPGLIRLARFTLDTGSGDPDAMIPEELRAPVLSGSERGYFLVQLSGPITLADHALIESFGGSIIQFIPDHAFLISITANGLEQLAAMPRVTWTGAYHPAYKISPQPQMDLPGSYDMTLLLFPDASLGQVADQIAAAGGVIQETNDNGINKMIAAEVNTADLTAIVQIQGVAWIEPWTQPQFHNDQCQWVVQTWQSNNRRIWDMGIRGQGQIGSLSDTGIRVLHTQFFDADVPLPGFGHYPTHRKVIAYVKTMESDNILFGDLNDYHGTHTSCTQAGSDDPNDTSNRDGMAKDAKIFFLDAGGFGGGVIVPTDLNDMLIIPYTGNEAGQSFVSSHSWGTSAGGYYTAMAMTSDQFMWSHKDHLAIYSNGNDGGAANTVGSPATSKSSIGAGGTGNGSSASQIYGATSRGPTDDGRLKPTINAPAQLWSAYGGSNDSYISYHGTSMAAPAIAGGCLLARQYLTDGWYPTGSPVPANAIERPSAAMLKALAINSASDDFTGSPSLPDFNFGWGRMLLDDALYFPGDTRKLALVDFNEGLFTGEYVEYQVYVASTATPLKAALVWTDYAGSPGMGRKLVNDLDLIADDGVNTYLGNVYSGGQSVTGGVRDDINVEECVRRDTPTIGVWTFRIEATEVPEAPQPFAFVVSGGLASDAGIVVLEKLNYGAEDMTIRVVDLNAGPTVQVTATSTTEFSTETVTLSGANGVYEGILPLTLTFPLTENGELSVANGDQVTITYEDANPVATLIAHAQIDLDGTVITDVHAVGIDEDEATIVWTTNTQVNGKVYYGTTPALGEETDLSANLILDHAILIDGLDANQTYYYDVESSDNQGNAIRDDNGGIHYSFTTGRGPDILLVRGDGTFPQLDRYDNAFNRSGWSYALWDGEMAATPYVGDANEGMASFKAVLWQTGYEQYPMFSDVARDSLTRLMDLGSRLATWSHDVAWDFCDPTADNYTVERCQWMADVLHAAWLEDPLTWDTMTGIAGDPISGDYTAGVPYHPHRSGAAGDEIDGVAGVGSFAYTWRNTDTTIDDIGLRWTSTFNIGDPANSLWGGTRNKVSSNFYEWAQVDDDFEDSEVRAGILDKTLTWLIGRDNPTVDIVSPNGGEVYTGSSASISWTETVDSGHGVALREIYYSDNGGESWTLITNAPGTSPYSWDISSIPNAATYLIRMVLADDGSPELISIDTSDDPFEINRPGGDTRGPKVVAGSMTVDPNPIVPPGDFTLTATLTDVPNGNQNVAAAEWSSGATPADPGLGTAMTGTFDSPVVDATAVIDSELLAPHSETLWVRGQDAGGVWGNATALVVAIATPTAIEELGFPLSYTLYPNAPNPFNPQTMIRFDLPSGSGVELAIFDVAGRLVRNLIDGSVPAGRRAVVWDGKDESGHAVGSGIYFYRIKTDAFEATRSMTLLK